MLEAGPCPSLLENINVTGGGVCGVCVWGESYFQQCLQFWALAQGDTKTLGEGGASSQ